MMFTMFSLNNVRNKSPLESTFIQLEMLEDAFLYSFKDLARLVVR